MANLSIKEKEVYINNEQVYVFLAKQFGLYPTLLRMSLNKPFYCFKDRIAFDPSKADLKDLDTNKNFNLFCGAYARCLQYKENGLVVLAMREGINLFWPKFIRPSPLKVDLTTKTIEVSSMLMEQFSFEFNRKYEEKGDAEETNTNGDKEL